MRKITVVFALLMSVASAHATKPDRTEAFKDAATEWSTPWIQSLRAGRKVVVLTKAHPQRRRACRVLEVQSDRLVCARLIHRETVFANRTILAVLDPKEPSVPRAMAITAGVGVGLITVGFFAGPAAPALWVIGGLVLLAVPAEAIGDNGPFHDTVVYYAPGSEALVAPSLI